MNEERIREVFSDEAFVKALLEKETPEQVQALLLEKDIEMTADEICKVKELIEKQLNGEINMEELSDEDLEKISGGIGGFITFCVIVTTAGLVGGAIGGAGAGIATQIFTRGRW